MKFCQICCFLINYNKALLQLIPCFHTFVFLILNYRRIKTYRQTINICCGFTLRLLNIRCFHTHYPFARVCMFLQGYHTSWHLSRQTTQKAAFAQDFGTHIANRLDVLPDVSSSKIRTKSCRTTLVSHSIWFMVLVVIKQHPLSAMCSGQLCVVVVTGALFRVDLYAFYFLLLFRVQSPNFTGRTSGAYSFNHSGNKINLQH